MRKRHKKTFLSKENYILLVESINFRIEEKYGFSKDCIYAKTKIHGCLTKDYCEFLGDKLIEFIKPKHKFKLFSEAVLDDLLCPCSSEHVSYKACLAIYDSENFPAVITDEKIYLFHSTYPLYIFFVTFCAILEHNIFLDFKTKKEVFQYLLYFFRGEGSIGRREKKAIKNLLERIRNIDKNLSIEETFKEIICIIAKVSFNKRDRKEKNEYFKFLEFMIEVLTWYIDNEKGNISNEFLGVVLGDSLKR